MGLFWRQIEASSRKQICNAGRSVFAKNDHLKNEAGKAVKNADTAVFGLKMTASSKATSSEVDTRIASEHRSGVYFECEVDRFSSLFAESLLWEKTLATFTNTASFAKMIAPMA